MLFCNRALEEWTGCGAEQLIGQRLRYRSAASRLKHEITAAALAPPPEVFEGRRCRTVLTIDRITSQSRRTVDFIPLTPGGVLALVEEAETGSAAPEASETVERRAASEIHQTLAVFRRRQAGRFRWDRLIGTSQQMQRIRRLGRLAVDSSASVLILGEEGTGKEHLANAIHYGSGGESTGALVPIECAVLDEELIAATIVAFRKRFNQEKSTRRHTLLLKDAEALGAPFLPMFLDFTAASPGNQRVIATSTVEPRNWPHSEPLGMLLGTIRIELPPLRERTEDIPLLAQLFLEERNEEAGKQRAGFTSDALDLLVGYRWPGNLRELEQTVEEAHAKASSTLVSVADLPARLRHVDDAASQRRPDDEPIDLDDFLRQIERELIERALRMADGNKSKAAEWLGLTRPRLYRRMEFFGLIDEDPGRSSIDR